MQPQKVVDILSQDLEEKKQLRINRFFGSQKLIFLERFLYQNCFKVKKPIEHIASILIFIWFIETFIRFSGVSFSSLNLGFIKPEIIMQTIMLVFGCTITTRGFIHESIKSK